MELAISIIAPFNSSNPCLDLFFDTKESTKNLSIWSTADKQCSSISPIIQTLHDPEFGRISLSWDHSSDLSTPLYDEKKSVV